MVLIQENHTFDDHFGGYCTAPPGSNPACTDGPACCEAMPSADPSGASPTVLDDTTSGGYDPPHDSACEAAEIAGGAMSAFVTAPAQGGSPCGDARNVARVDPTLIQPLWDLAAGGALADRYFQPIVGESYANDMYFARARFVFDDNSVSPAGAVGDACALEVSNQKTYTDETIGDLLTAAGVPWAFYAEGYAAMVAAGGQCPPKPDDCPFRFPFDPCGFEPSDVPFEFYASTRDDPATMKDLADFYAALDGGGLPAVSFVKNIEYKSEHPGQGLLLSAGIAAAGQLVDRVEQSRYRGNTLVLVTYDEGGGYFDHVPPPPASAVDGKPYGTRVPMLALGPFARKGTVSHVVMEHSSVVKLLEWNFLGGITGQLGGRDGDATLANMGSLLDPVATGTPVPVQ